MKSGPFKLELDTAIHLNEQMFSESAHGYTTLPIKRIEHYLENYRTLWQAVKHKIDDSNKAPASLTQSMHAIEIIISSQFMRIFSARENASVQATKPEDLTDAIDSVEKTFIACVEKAQKYFGDFLTGDFHFGTTTTEELEPHSVEEILNLINTSKKLCNYEIHYGYPQPQFRARFNKMLEQCVKNFIKSYIDECNA